MAAKRKFPLMKLNSDNAVIITRCTALVKMGTLFNTHRTIATPVVMIS